MPKTFLSVACLAVLMLTGPRLYASETTSSGGVVQQIGEPVGGYAEEKVERQTDRVTTRVDNKIDQKTDEAVDKALNKLFDKIFK